MHILHVEDDPAGIFLVREILKSLAFSVEISVAANGEEALQILYRESFATSGSPVDLILLDLIALFKWVRPDSHSDEPTPGCRAR